MGAVYMAGHSKYIWSARYHFAFGYFTSVHLINFIKTYIIHIYILTAIRNTHTRPVPTLEFTIKSSQKPSCLLR